MENGQVYSENRETYVEEKKKRRFEETNSSSELKQTSL